MKSWDPWNSLRELEETKVVKDQFMGKHNQVFRRIK